MRERSTSELRPAPINLKRHTRSQKRYRNRLQLLLLRLLQHRQVQVFCVPLPLRGIAGVAHPQHNGQKDHFEAEPNAAGSSLQAVDLPAEQVGGAVLVNDQRAQGLVLDPSSSAESLGHHAGVGHPESLSRDHSFRVCVGDVTNVARDDQRFFGDVLLLAESDRRSREV